MPCLVCVCGCVDPRLVRVCGCVNTRAGRGLVAKLRVPILDKQERSMQGRQKGDPAAKRAKLLLLLPAWQSMHLRDSLHKTAVCLCAAVALAHSQLNRACSHRRLPAVGVGFSTVQPAQRCSQMQCCYSPTAQQASIRPCRQTRPDTRRRPSMLPLFGVGTRVGETCIIVMTTGSCGPQQQGRRWGGADSARKTRNTCSPDASRAAAGCAAAEVSRMTDWHFAICTVPHTSAASQKEALAQARQLCKLAAQVSGPEEPAACKETNMA